MTAVGRAEVIGAGVAGLTTATALAQRGWSVRLHEREPEIRAIGAGIYLWGNGLAVLKALGVYDAATVGVHIGPSQEIRDGSNQVIQVDEINAPGAPTLYTVMRGRLIRALVDGAKAAGVEIRTNSPIVEADPGGAVLTASGERFEADVVVAADGVNSGLRDRFDLVLERHRMSQGATRLVIDRRPEFVPAADQDKYIAYFNGPREVLYTPSSATELYLALVADTMDSAASAVPVDIETWIESFPHLEAMLRATKDVPTRWDTFEYIRLRRWSEGRIAFVGDVAHAQPPHLAQGGGCAMMGALGLAHALSTLTDAVEQRLAVWEATERPLIEHTQRWSYRHAHAWWDPRGDAEIEQERESDSKLFGGSQLDAALAVPTGAVAFTG